MSEYSTQRDALVAALGRVLPASAKRFGEVVWRDDPDELKQLVLEELPTAGTYRVHAWMLRPAGTVETERTQGKRRRDREWWIYGYMSVDTRTGTTWTQEFYELAEAIENELEEHVRASGAAAYVSPPEEVSTSPDVPLVYFGDIACNYVVFRIRMSAFRRRTAQS